MGNCFKTASLSTTEWAGDDWSSLTSKHNINKTTSSKVLDSSYDVVSEKTQLLGALGASSKSREANGRVTIKISKKDLEDLLRVIEKQKQNTNKKEEGGGGPRVSAEQLLVRLLNTRDHHRPWRPVLESIPEII